MQPALTVSVVVPTCNRKLSLLRLIESLTQSEYPLAEVIVVDSGDQQLAESELRAFTVFNLRYIKTTDRSVCVQRNIGVQQAISPWILLCDDDLEVPSDYVKKLVTHAIQTPVAGAISGFFLQKENGKWVEQYPVKSAGVLLWRFIFQLSIWGEINCEDRVILFTKAIKKYYRKKGNHISKAGWPVITDFSGQFFRTPVYTLGASLIKKQWLSNSPYDEILDPHGIGDNYGVAVGFPPEGIHILKTAFVYHHHEAANRIVRSSQYFRRALAIDYFIKTKKELKYISRVWFLWSLFGNMILFILSRNGMLVNVTFKLFTKILLGKNPYVRGKTLGGKIVTPQL